MHITMCPSSAVVHFAACTSLNARYLLFFDRAIVECDPFAKIISRTAPPCCGRAEPARLTERLFAVVHVALFEGAKLDRGSRHRHVFESKIE